MWEQILARKVDDLTDPMQAMPQEKRKKTEEEVAGEDETEATPEGLKLRKDSGGNYWAEVLHSLARISPRMTCETSCPTPKKREEERPKRGSLSTNLRSSNQFTTFMMICAL